MAGHFNSDGVLDLFIQHSSNGVMKVKQTNQPQVLSCFFSPSGLKWICWHVTFAPILLMVFPPLLCLSDINHRWGERDPFVGRRVRVSPASFRNVCNLHVHRPIRFPVLGQRSNQSTEECYQDNRKSSSDRIARLMRTQEEQPSATPVHKIILLHCARLC